MHQLEIVPLFFFVPDVGLRNGVSQLWLFQVDFP